MRYATVHAWVTAWGRRGVADQQKYSDAFAAPESKKAMHGALSFDARVDFRQPHTPLLFVAGGADRIMPAALNRQPPALPPRGLRDRLCRKPSHCSCRAYCAPPRTGSKFIML